MENASKALIIAGSILIAILLIAVGMRIFNSTLGAGDSVKDSISTNEKSMINNKFMPYIGKNKTRAEILALRNAVIVHNATSDKGVYLNIATTEGGNNYAHLASPEWKDSAKLNEYLNKYLGRLDVSYYNVKYSASNGLIHKIYINPVGK